MFPESTTLAVVDTSVIPTDELIQHPAWLALKSAAVELQGLQAQDGSLAQDADRARAAALVNTLTDAITDLTALFPHDDRLPDRPGERLRPLG